MQKSYLSDQEFSEFIYSQLEQQNANHLNFAKVVCGVKTVDEALGGLGLGKNDESAA